MIRARCPRAPLSEVTSSIAPVVAPFSPDASQFGVLQHDAGALLVIGAPGTGKVSHPPGAVRGPDRRRRRPRAGGVGPRVVGVTSGGARLPPRQAARLPAGTQRGHPARSRQPRTEGPVGGRRRRRAAADPVGGRAVRPRAGAAHRSSAGGLARVRNPARPAGFRRRGPPVPPSGAGRTADARRHRGRRRPARPRRLAPARQVPRGIPDRDGRPGGGRLRGTGPTRGLRGRRGRAVVRPCARRRLSGHHPGRRSGDPRATRARSRRGGRPRGPRSLRGTTRSRSTASLPRRSTARPRSRSTNHRTDGEPMQRRARCRTAPVRGTRRDRPRAARPSRRGRRGLGRHGGGGAVAGGSVLGGLLRRSGTVRIPRDDPRTRALATAEARHAPRRPRVALAGGRPHPA